MFDDLENKKDRYFHVTPRKNLSAIQKEGLLAQIGDRSQEAKEEAEAVFLFPSKEDMDNALLNWLGEAFEEEDELIILQIDLPADFPVKRDADSNGELMYEAYSYKNIPPEYISAIYDEAYELIESESDKEKDI